MGVSPVYSIHGYSEHVYKVIAWKGVRDPDKVRIRHIEEEKHNSVKLDNNISRARSMVLQYALCNDWQFFFTGTLNKSKFNRFDLDSFQTKLSQFIRDQRKKYKSQIQFLLVPEQHEDGAWHMHGLVSGLPETAYKSFWDYDSVPYDLKIGGFFDYPDYSKKFGFCSLGRIKNPTAVSFYIVKYVSKSVNDRSLDLSKHLYFHSRPLRKAVKVSDVYLYHQRLEDLCVNDYDFCKTGMVQDASFAFPYQWEGSDFNEIDFSSLFPDPDLDLSYLEPTYEQLKMIGV